MLSVRACLAPALALLAGALALVLTPSCASAPSASGVGGAGGAGGGALSADQGVTLFAGIWTLTWDKTRVTPDAPSEGSGWSVTNDLGYRVHLSAGTFVDYSASFGLCDPNADAGAALFPLRLGVRAALAHEDGNASTITLMHAEDLTHPEDPPAWEVVFPPARYCRAHWLVGRADSSIDAPAGVDLVGTSLRLSGQWARGRSSGRFAVHTWWPEGRLVDLEDAVAPAELAAARRDGGAFAASVTVRRRLGALFDGIDLAAASDDQIIGQAVHNLVSSAEVTVRLWKPDEG